MLENPKNSHSCSHLENSKNSHISTHTFVFAKNVIQTIKDMTSVSFLLNDDSFQERSFSSSFHMIAHIHFVGTIEGDYLLSLNEVLAAKLIDAYEDGMSDDNLREIREDYGDFIKEVLNTAVGRSITKLEQTFGNLTYTYCVLVYGEIEFPEVSSGGVKIEGENGEILCGFSLNLVKLKIGRRLEEAKAENLRMKMELDIARRLQEMVLPSAKELKLIDDLDIAAFMKPADEIGGDYYDVLTRDGHTLIGIGDVTGHGLESGVLMMMTQAVIRTLLIHGETELKQFLNTVNQVLYNNAQRMQIDKIMTLVLLEYHAGKLRISGQHEEVIIIRKEGKVECLDTLELGFFIGLKNESAHFFNETTISLEVGESVVLYTDGITEARNIEKKMYGQKRLCNVINKSWDGSAEQIKNAVVKDVYRYIGKQEILDDITLLVFKRRQ
nr:PP2C family protein-serine/threonine phosphatase [Candidatus Parabeggiatoa sp.]